MQEENKHLSRRAGAASHRAGRQPERGRHLQLEVRQLRARLNPPYDMSYTDDRAAVDADHLPDACWSTARRAGPPIRRSDGRLKHFKTREGGRVRECRPLGASRPPRRLRRHGEELHCADLIMWTARILRAHDHERAGCARSNEPDRRNPRLYRLREVARGRAAAGRAVQPAIAAGDHRPGAGLEGPQERRAVAGRQRRPAARLDGLERRRRSTIRRRSR